MCSYPEFGWIPIYYVVADVLVTVEQFVFYMHTIFYLCFFFVVACFVCLCNSFEWRTIGIWFFGLCAWWHLWFFLNELIEMMGFMGLAIICWKVDIVVFFLQHKLWTLLDLIRCVCDNSRMSGLPIVLCKIYSFVLLKDEWFMFMVICWFMLFFGVYNLKDQNLCLRIVDLRGRRLKGFTFERGWG